MGLFDKGGSQKQTTEVKQPEWVTQAGQQAVNRATGIANQPYVSYPGARVAGLSPNEQYAASQAPGELNRYGGAFTTASNMAMQGAAPNDQYWLNNYQAYMNPYMKSAIDPAAREVARQAEANRLQNNMQSSMTGSFGGARTGVREAEERRGELQTIGDLYSRGLADAYGQGMQGFQMDTGIRQSNRDLALRGSEMMSLIPGREAQIRDAAYQRMLQTGGLQRGLNQAALDTAYQNFLEQRDWPIRGLSALSSTISGLPQQGTTTVKGPEANILSQLAGAGLAGASMYYGGPLGYGMQGYGQGGGTA